MSSFTEVPICTENGVLERELEELLEEGANMERRCPLPCAASALVGAGRGGGGEGRSAWPQQLCRE